MMSNFAGLTLARVITFHPHDHSCDCQLMFDGSRLTGVPILSGNIGTSSGKVDWHEPEGNDWETAGSKTRDIVAVVGSLNDQPIVIGFMADQVSQMMFDRTNFKVDRHASDVYSTIDKDGNIELAHPSGTFVRIATDPAHEDLTAKDWDKIWKIDRNKKQPVWLSIRVAGVNASNIPEVKATIRIDPRGNIFVESAGYINVRSQFDTTFTAQKLIINAPTEINGSVNVYGDILHHNNVNVGFDHKHKDVTPGTSLTGFPA